MKTQWGTASVKERSANQARSWLDLARNINLNNFKIKYLLEISQKHPGVFFDATMMFLELVHDGTTVHWTHIIFVFNEREADMNEWMNDLNAIYGDV